MVICLKRCADCLHMVQLMPLHLKTPSSYLASFKSRLVLPFWYRLTRVVPDKGPLNECTCMRVCVCVLLSFLRTCNTRRLQDDQLALNEAVLELREDDPPPSAESGMYICVADNDAGNATLTVSLPSPYSSPRGRETFTNPRSTQARHIIILLPRDAMHPRY